MGRLSARRVRFRDQSLTVAGDGEGSGTNTDGRQVFPTDPPVRQDEPEPVQAGGSENDQREGRADVNERGVGQNYPHPHSDSRVAMGSGSGRGNDPDEALERSGKTNGA